MTPEAEELALIEQLDTSSRASFAPRMSEQYRIGYDPAGQYVFDCRFHGAGECITQSRFSAFIKELSRLSSEARWSKTGGRYTLTTDLSERSIAAMQAMVTLKDKTPTQVDILIKRHWRIIADEVGYQIGRQVGNEVVRRMGIGDQIVLFGVIQQLITGGVIKARHCRVLVDPHYPASLMIARDMMRLPVCEASHFNNLIPPFWENGQPTWINCRHHMLEHSTIPFAPPLYAETIGDPAKQPLYNWGWHTQPFAQKVRCAGYTFPRPYTDITPDDPWIDPDVPFITCQPIELTRKNIHATPLAYSFVLQMACREQGIYRVMFSASPDEQGALQTFIKDLALPPWIKARTVSFTLLQWSATVAQSSLCVTGNTSGMWLAYGHRVPCIILSRQTEMHGSLWNPKPEWFEDSYGGQVNALI